MKVYIGWDPRETAAYRVAERSLRRHASVPVDVTPLVLDNLRSQGLISRPLDRRGVAYDVISGAAWSTEFAVSRFLVPMLAQSGMALFVDADVLFLGDIAEMLVGFDPAKAVHVVQHRLEPADEVKMDGQPQQAYGRKNWSSVCLWNCDHPANRRLSLRDVNERTGRDLHAFYWLHDSEIGELAPRWNWLVGCQPEPVDARIAHYTLGTPDMLGREMSPYAYTWFREAQ